MQSNSSYDDNIISIFTVGEMDILHIVPSVPGLCDSLGYAMWAETLTLKTRSWSLRQALFLTRSTA